MASCPSCGKRYSTGVFCPDDGSALDGTGSEPRTIDRYRILGKIGEGGMSEVFEATHINLGKKVALKLLRRELADDADAVERFRREARTTGALGHPNVVHVIDFGTADDGALFLAMEWLQGETLASLIARGPVAQDLALEIVEQVCDGLSAAHAADVVHRDVKPANVFLTEDLEGHLVAKVLDFGIAKLTQVDPGLTRTGTFVGTPDYIAPEQALGEAVDARADVYAVGVILYEMLTGTRPFVADGFIGMIHAHAVERPQPPSRRAPARGIGAELDAMVMRCLEKEPRKRFASIAALGAAVHAARGGSERSFFDRLRASGTEPEALEPPDDDAGSTTRLPATPAATAPRRVMTPLPLPVLGGTPSPWRLRREGGRRAGLPWLAPLLGLIVGAIAIALLVRRSSPGPVDPRTLPVWKHLKRDGELELTTWIRPRPIAAGAPFHVELELVPLRELRARWRPPLELVLTFEDLADRTRPARRTARVDADGRAAIDVSLPRSGTYRMAVELSDDGAPLVSAAIDLCVGADPTRPSRELERLCPGMTTTRPR